MSDPSLHHADDAARPSGTPRHPAVGLAQHRAGDLRPRRWTSHSLLAGATEIEIEHDGAVYRLRQTLLGKLLLTK